MRTDWPVWAEIACYDCGTRTAGRFVGRNPARVAMRQEAVSKGWRLLVNEWCCPKCLKEIVDSNPIKVEIDG